MGKLVYGCWQLGGGDAWAGVDPAAARRCVRAAFDLGVRVFDTAPVYGNGASESALGEALGADRARCSIVTKFGYRFDDTGRSWQDFSEASVRHECEASLRRLRTDRIDLYLLHAPGPGLVPESLARTLVALAAEGKIAAWGVSNVAGADLARFVRLGASWCQGYHNVLEPGAAAAGQFPYLGGAAFMAYSPLARGLLTAKDIVQAAASPDGALRRLASGAGGLETRLEVLAAAAKRRGTSVPRLALDWLAADARTRAVAVGARDLEHLREAVEALGVLVSLEND